MVDTDNVANNQRARRLREVDNPMTTMSREVKIKEIAYGLWEQEGRPEGRDLEHYFKAEQIADEPKPKARAKTATTRTTKTKTTATATTRKPARKRAASS